MRAEGALRAIGAAAVGLFAALAFTPLPNLMHRVLVPPPPPAQPAQAIVVLGAGLDDTVLQDASLRRALHGIELYHQGLAPLLVMLGPGETTTEADVRVALAAGLGVPRSALVAEARGRTTRDEARVSWEALASRSARRILLVTGGQHMPRAAAFFRQAGFDVVPAPAEELPAGADRPQGRLALARGLLRELVARTYNLAAGYL
ncbi:MAG TPA: YdcF family protein [Vicinamibacteria bacterium]